MFLNVLRKSVHFVSGRVFCVFTLHCHDFGSRYQCGDRLSGKARHRNDVVC